MFELCPLKLYSYFGFLTGSVFGVLELWPVFFNESML